MKCDVVEGYIGEMPEAISEEMPAEEEVVDLVEIKATEVDASVASLVKSNEGSDFARKMTAWLEEHPKITIWKLIHHFTDDGVDEDLIVAIIYYIERPS